MSPNWIYALVAGASMMTVGCQPFEPDFSPGVGPPKPEAIERESSKLDDRVARHQARWKARKQQLPTTEP